MDSPKGPLARLNALRSRDNEPAGTPFEMPATQPTTDVATAIGDLGLNLLRRTSESGRPNVVVSPYSVAALLAMTANGANGETGAEMRRVLYGNSIGPEEAGRQWVGLSAAIGSRSQPSLSIASAIWVRKNLGLLPGFAASIRAKFGCEICSADFDSIDAAAAVNRWAADRTRGLIDDIVQHVSPESRLLLVNAVRFQGMWKVPFRSDGTQAATFTLPDGSGVEVSMMSREDNSIQCIRTRSFFMVRLPYKGSDNAMYVVLPNRELGLAGLLSTLTGQDFIGSVRFTAKTPPREFLILGLPRLDLAWGSDDLAEALSAMGMPSAFEPSKADFGAIAKEKPLFISRFLHRTRIKVGELGTEAAAASYEMLAMGFPPRLVFDRPFVFGIVDEKSGAVLFLGAVNDPRP